MAYVIDTPSRRLESYIIHTPADVGRRLDSYIFDTSADASARLVISDALNGPSGSLGYDERSTKPLGGHQTSVESSDMKLSPVYLIYL